MKIIRYILCIFLILSFSACSREQTEDIYILYTNDIASHINGDNISMAGVKAYKDYLKSQNKYVVLVDAGDYYDGDLGQYDGGIHMTELMNACEYDFVTIGNQEFSVGLDNLANNINHSNFKSVSCNIKYIGKGSNPLKSIKPYEIKRYGGVKIAFIGVTTPETLKPGKLASAAISDESGNYIYSFYEGNEGEELYKQVQNTINKVRNKVDYVIVLSHLGENSVEKGFSSVDLIANTTGIDVLIDGHSHTINYGTLVTDKEGKGVVLTSTGEKLQYLGELIIHKDHSFTTMLYPSVAEKDPSIVEMMTKILSGN